MVGRVCIVYHLQVAAWAHERAECATQTNKTFYLHPLRVLTSTSVLRSRV